MKKKLSFRNLVIAAAFICILGSMSMLPSAEASGASDDMGWVTWKFHGCATIDEVTEFLNSLSEETSRAAMIQLGPVTPIYITYPNYTKGMTKQNKTWTWKSLLTIDDIIARLNKMQAVIDKLSKDLDVNIIPRAQASQSGK